MNITPKFTSDSKGFYNLIYAYENGNITFHTVKYGGSWVGTRSHSSLGVHELKNSTVTLFNTSIDIIY